MALKLWWASVEKNQRPLGVELLKLRRSHEILKYVVYIVAMLIALWNTKLISVSIILRVKMSIPEHNADQDLPLVSSKLVFYIFWSYIVIIFLD